jgi:hypothetical protein
VNQARSAFKRKVKKAGATFFYGAMCGFFTAEELDDILFEASEVAKFLLEVEGTSLDIDEEISVEDRITGVMRTVAESAARVLRAREAGGDQGKEAGKGRPGRRPVRAGADEGTPSPGEEAPAPGNSDGDTGRAGTSSPEGEPDGRPPGRDPVRDPGGAGRDPDRGD